MDLGQRVQRYIFSEMMIDPYFGLMQLISYMDDLEVGMSEQLVMEKYRENKKLNETLFYTASEQPVLMAEPQLKAGSEQKRVAIINLNGTMSVEGGLCTEGIDSFVRSVSKAKADPSVIGAVIKTYSGGGAVLAAQRASMAVDDFREVKPVVQWGDYIASGAYMVGASCNEIVAGGKMSEVGSIGVVIQINKEVIEDIKENVVSIYADGSEDKHDTIKAIIEERYDFVKQSRLNPIRKEFVDSVKTGRSKIKEEALTGSMFFAKDAKRNGLVDHIGNLDLAVRRVVTLNRRYNSRKNARKMQKNV